MPKKRVQDLKPGDIIYGDQKVDQVKVLGRFVNVYTNRAGSPFRMFKLGEEVGVKAAPRGNPHMVPAYWKGQLWKVETDQGVYFVFPDQVSKDPANEEFADHVQGEIELIEMTEEGWFCHMSAPGYLDQTEWEGPFATRAEARCHIVENFDVDPDSGEPLEDNA